MSDQVRSAVRSRQLNDKPSQLQHEERQLRVGLLAARASGGICRDLDAFHLQGGVGNLCIGAGSDARCLVGVLVAGLFRPP
ncbi:hypothetical protein [Actinacidiphila yanglinensis]|uniref:hypothetical protein n=1 Tax=Actinacidiphila yanglinensis TaxID=310779 RepID=UPI00190ED575|nr:hypothetical protein [Actinacidiphila yanglinensis]